MTKKQTFTLIIALVAVMMIGTSLAAAQGPRNGGRGQGSRNMLNQTDVLGQNLRNQQQLQDPLLQQQALNGAGGRNAWRGQNRGQNGGGLAVSYASMPPFEGELPADVTDALLEGLADELHAYATYEAVLAQFGNVAPFSAIINAEASHAAALQNALDYYGVDYSSVTPAAEPLAVATLAEACQIAADAEIANFELYDRWIGTVSEYPDLVQLFTNLRDASEFSHLPAFEACAG